MKKLLFAVTCVITVFLDQCVAYAGTTSSQPPLPSESSTGSLFGSVAIMVVVIGAAWVGLRIFLKKFKVAQKGNVNILAVRQVVPNKFVGVVTVYGKNYVVGIGETISLLDQIPDEQIHGNDFETEEEKESPSDLAHLVREHLQTLSNKYGRGGGEQ